MKRAPRHVAGRLHGRRRSNWRGELLRCGTHSYAHRFAGPRPTRRDLDGVWIRRRPTQARRSVRCTHYRSNSAFDPRSQTGDGTAGTDAGSCWGPGDRCGGCANADESVGRKQLVVQRLCGFCAAPRKSGGDRVPIELPTGGTELLHCREKRGLLRRSPASILIHGEGCWPEELGQVGVDGCVLLPRLLERSAMCYATVLVRAQGRGGAPDIRHRTLVGADRKRATMHGAHWVVCGAGGGTRRRQIAISTATTNAQLSLYSYRWTKCPLQSWCRGNVGSDHGCAPVKSGGGVGSTRPDDWW